MSVSSNIHLFKLLLAYSSGLTLIVIVESFGVNENLDDGVADSAPYEVFQLDAVRQGWLRHVKKLVFQVIHFVVVLQSLREFVDDCSEKHVDNECVDGALVENVYYSPEILQALGTFFILHGQYEIQKVFVIHFALVCLVLFEYPINEDVGQTWTVSCQLLLFKHAVFVLVQSQICVIYS